MADVVPFVATRFASCDAQELAQKLAPPYDVIDAPRQQQLYDAHKHNIVRVDYGRKLPNDDDYENRYTRSEATWREWRKSGVLTEDTQKGFYVYEQEFDVPGTGERARRRGFFGAVRLQDFSEGGIRAHEQTFDGPKADRFRLMRSTSCNLSPIFCVYTDLARSVDKAIESGIAGLKPIEATFDDVVHRLWILTKPAAVAAISKTMQEQTLFIADGHHRYETALLYRDEMRATLAKQNGAQPWDYTLMYLNNTCDEGLAILPTHRVLSREACVGIDVTEILSDLEENFEIEPIKIDHAQLEAEAARLTQLLEVSGKRAPSFIMLLPKGGARLLRLRPEADLDDLIDDETIPLAIKQLDVTLLHQYVINRQVLGNPEIELDDQDVCYVKDAARAIDMMKNGRHGIAFLMNPTRIDQVTTIAEMGLRMPHKSTYFYPKLCTGMVMRDLNSPF
jgi:uncharacterized protein (DUF1015 family)